MTMPTNCRSVSRRLAAILAAVFFLSLGCGGGSGSDEARTRVIVLGFDGLDHEFTQRLITEGRLPNFERLAKQGTFSPLITAVPPQSPVAWSNFITGSDSGAHGIFDFIHRDPETLLPYLSTSSAEAGASRLKLGNWQVPASGEVSLLRHGEEFWSRLEENGFSTTIIRMPANFPPSGTASREISGMGTPDVLGTYGTFSFYTSDPYSAYGEVEGGHVYDVIPVDDLVTTELKGPPNPFRVDAADLTTELLVYLDEETAMARIVVGDEECLIAAGEWSEWVPIAFEMVPGMNLDAIGRFYLRQITPEFELYVTPLNFDPKTPGLPISTPEDYAAELADASGRYYTQGMPEDTTAIKEKVLRLPEFVAQAKLAGEENVAQYKHVLETFDGDLLFYYFGNVDLVSHILWRSMDPAHPAYNPNQDPLYADVIPQLYQQMDAIVGQTLEQVTDDTLVVVMSDHGFSSWRRAMHLNAWLRKHGYLGVLDSERTGKYLSNVDWANTRAYAVGLNGLYVNLSGRELKGIVDPAERDALLTEISQKLLATIDPATGERAISKIYRREETYSDGGYRNIGPDLQVGYAKMTRSSDESAGGEVGSQVFTDNINAWSGDHCMDHEAVPGILLTSRPLKKPATSLENLAAAILAEFGIEQFPSPSE